MRVFGKDNIETGFEVPTSRLHDQRQVQVARNIPAASHLVQFFHIVVSRLRVVVLDESLSRLVALFFGDCSREADDQQEEQESDRVESCHVKVNPWNRLSLASSLFFKGKSRPQVMYAC